ncbi:MAG TPA: hypothetical protein VMT89_08225 [Candidatus Acidoferrales bacterium]|nr:hypothetical protein [Candidatus Acidoferrales bacterium]
MAEWHYRRPQLYPKQGQFLFAPERYSIVEASTKSGKMAPQWHPALVSYAVASHC